MKKIAVSLALIFVFLAAGCAANAGTPAAPTVAPEAIFTAGAQTVIANLTLNAPTITLAPPEPTVAPIIPTLPPLDASGGLATLPVGGLATLPVGGLGETPLAPAAPAALATFTLTPQPDGTDKAELTLQDPWDNSEFPIANAGIDFNVTWQLKNTGGTTWTTQYSLKYVSGDKILKVDQVFLPRAVPPNDVINFIIPADYPGKKGSSQTNWALVTDKNISFYKLYLAIKMVD